LPRWSTCRPPSGIIWRPEPIAIETSVPRLTPSEPIALAVDNALRVIQLAPGDRRWEAYVANHPDGLIYHHPAWVQVLTREYDRPSLCLAAEDSSGRLRGILPMLRTRGVPFATGASIGQRLSSLPRTPVAGPLTTDEQSTVALLVAAVERVRREPGTRFECKVASALPDGVPGLACQPWRISYSLELAPDPDRLRFGTSRNHARIRWAVHKAARNGVQVRPAETVKDLRAWYELYLQTMQSHAVPPRPYRFFQAAWDALVPRRLMEMLVAERAEGPRRTMLAGSLFLMFGRTVFYAFNGCAPEGRSLRANDLVQWRAIGDACRAGFQAYDLGEVVETQDGLHDFKAKWGAQPRRLYRAYSPPPGRSQAAGVEAGHLARAAWRRLPRRATAMLGDRVYSFL
jgi:CelD/BcsL family acetyltransferase involved in cellulose biosynthesis